METGYSAKDIASGRDSVAWTELGKNWGWAVGVGVLLAIIGCFAIGSSFVATMAAVYFLGWMMIAGAIVHAVHVFRVQGWNLRLFQAILAVLYFVAGILVVRQPIATAASLTLMLAAFLMITGLFRLINALIENVPMRGWMVFNGIITALLGFLVMYQWPISSLWVIGLFIGIDLVISGGTLIGLGMRARQIAHFGEGMRPPVSGGPTAVPT